MTTEVWKPQTMVETTNHVEVSNMGGVRRAINRSPRLSNKPQWHTMSAFERPDGYMSVNIADGKGNATGVLLHRLVWHTFNGEIPDDHFVVPKAKNDARLSTLRLVNSSEHLRQRAKLQPRRRGEDHPNAALTVEKAAAIKRMVARAPRSPSGGIAYGEAKRIAEAVGATRSSVSNIIQGKSWQHV